MPSPRSPLARRWRRLWNSDRLAPLRFYGWYFRWPLALALLALAGEKLIFYGGLPLDATLRREWAYFQAERDYRAGRNEAALYQIRQALLQTRNDAALWRLAARIGDRLDSPEAAYCWQQADRLEPGALETELALADTALRNGQSDLAAGALREVPVERQDDLMFLIDAGRLALAQGDEARADFYFEQAEALGPADPRSLSALADWHAARNQPGDAAKARTLLTRLASGASHRLDALRKLVALDLRQHDLSAGRNDESLLLASPGATFADRVQLLDLADDPAAGAPQREPFQKSRDQEYTGPSSVAFFRAPRGVAGAVPSPGASEASGMSPSEGSRHRLDAGASPAVAGTGMHLQPVAVDLRATESNNHTSSQTQRTSAVAADIPSAGASNASGMPPDPVGTNSGGIIENDLAQLLRTASPADAALVLDWMTAHGRAEPALIWIRHQDESWQDDPSIGLARAHALESLGDWVHLRDDQRDSIWPGREPERLMVLAQASLALGRRDDARAAWHRAVAACAMPDDFTALEQAAREFHDGNEARAEVWFALANRFPGQQWPLRNLLRYQVGRGDLVSARQIATRLAALAPGDADLAATRDLLILLRGSDTRQASSDLARLDAAAPGDPAVATAAAYSLYLQGRFADALATLGALEPADLRAPERAPYLGQMLAAAAPPDQAEPVLREALAQPGLLDEQRAGIERALDLVAARRALKGLKSPYSLYSLWKTRFSGPITPPSGQPVFLIVRSVALGPGQPEAAAALAQVDPLALDRPELVLYQGALLALAGAPAQAAPCLELAPTLPVEPPAAIWHRAVETWWSLENRAPSSNAFAPGLLAAYRGLESTEPSEAFWRSDAGREMSLTRAALARRELAGPVQARLEALLRHVPPTPEIEAEIGYALFLQGRIDAGRQRLEVLSAADLTRPEPARYYAEILKACGETRRAKTYALLAQGGGKSP